MNQRFIFFLFYQKYIYIFGIQMKIKKYYQSEREREREKKKLRKSNHISYLINILLEIDESMKWAMYILWEMGIGMESIPPHSFLSLFLSL